MRKEEYLITIKTCDERYAGTDSNIFLILFGERGQSTEVRLNGHAKKDLFERNAEDEIYIPFTDFGGDLGRVHKIKIRSDHLYGGADWRLDYVKIKRIEDEEEDKKNESPSNKESVFRFNDWIADKETHTLEDSVKWPSNSCKFIATHEDYAIEPLSISSYQTYKFKKVEKTTSSFRYSDVITKESTSEFSAAIKGDFDFPWLKKKFEKLVTVSGSEDFLNFAFKKGFTESRVSESTKEEVKEITVANTVLITNETDQTREYEVIYKMQKIYAIVTLGGITGMFQVNEKLLYAGTRDAITKEFVTSDNIESKL